MVGSLFPLICGKLGGESPDLVSKKIRLAWLVTGIGIFVGGISQHYAAVFLGFNGIFYWVGIVLLIWSYTKDDK